MTSFQKIMKYLAIAFAFFLIATIAYGLISGVSFFADMFGESDFNGKTESFAVGENTKYLKIDLGNSDIIIKEGDKLTVESTKENIVVKEKLGSFSIVEKKNSLQIKEQGQVVLTVPKGYVFDKVNIDTGKGKLIADVLKSKKVNLDFGAGEVVIDNLISTEDTEIDGGAGKVTIKDGKICDADFDMGAGRLDVTAEITGNSDFDCGVGNVSINLKGKEENYRLKINKGLGAVTIKGEAVSDGTVYGNGPHTIGADGGVGEIKIDFVK